ncbi:MAG: BrnT family toxin [Sphingomonadaceae bacterium]|nr:BrnT family toxin [Sphingomonadaceae bacterium]
MSAPEEFEFDRAKSKENWRKHGMGLEAGRLIFDSLYFEVVDRRRDYGETRLVAIGPLGGGSDNLLSITYVWRDDRRRLISVRQASGPERRGYRDRHASYGRSRSR